MAWFNFFAPTTSFVSDQPMTVDQLHANYPVGMNAGASAYRGKYARVSDYGGYVDRVVRCDYESSSGLYFWTPTQPEYARSVPIVGDTTLYALKHPTTMILTGSIGTGQTRNVTIDLANRRPGEIIELRNNMSSLLGALNILGTGLGSFLFNTLGGYSRTVVDSSSGALQLVRLQ